MVIQLFIQPLTVTHFTQCKGIFHITEIAGQFLDWQIIMSAILYWSMYMQISSDSKAGGKNILLLMGEKLKKIKVWSWSPLVFWTWNVFQRFLGLNTGSPPGAFWDMMRGLRSGALVEEVGYWSGPFMVKTGPLPVHSLLLECRCIRTNQASSPTTICSLPTAMPCLDRSHNPLEL